MTDAEDENATLRARVEELEAQLAPELIRLPSATYVQAVADAQAAARRKLEALCLRVARGAFDMGYLRGTEVPKHISSYAPAVAFDREACREVELPQIVTRVLSEGNG